MTITLLRPDGITLTAQQHRQGLAPLNGGGFGRPLGGRSGFRIDTPSNIFTVTSTTWTLLPCSAMIDPAATTHQGMYGWATDQNVTGSVTAADATYARKDIAYIQVNDSSAGDGSGALSAPVSYLVGTPAASPVAPDLPARSFLVATVNVPQVGGGSPTATLNPARFVAAGGLLPIGSKAERDTITPYVGMQVCRLDRDGWIQTYTGIMTGGASGWEYRGTPKRVAATVSTFANTSGNASRLLLTMTGLTKPYAQQLNAKLKLSINCGSIASGVLSVNAAVSLGSAPTVASAQGRAALSWTAPGAYLQTANAKTDWRSIAAGTDPQPRAWVEVTSGTVTNTVSTDATYSSFYVEIRPDDD